MQQRVRPPLSSFVSPTHDGPHMPCMKGVPCTPENAHSTRHSYWLGNSILSARLYLHMRISTQSPHHTSNHEPSRSHYIGDIHASRIRCRIIYIN